MADVCQSVSDGMMPPDAASVILSNIQWRASKLEPKKYSDRSSVEVDAGPGLVGLLAKLSD